MKRLLLWIPLALFVAIAALAALRLAAPTESQDRSRMVGKSLPAIILPAAIPGKPGLAASEGPRLVNIFASWCVPCIAEAPQLLALKRRGIVIDAIAIRDRPEDIAAFLSRWGDPYRAIGADPDSRVQLSLGSSGVPETFLVDRGGIVRLQHIGPIAPDHLPGIIAAYKAAR